MKPRIVHKTPTLTWAEVNLRAIFHNLKVIRHLATVNRLSSIPFLKVTKERIQKTKILSVIKANAYGHGIKEVGLSLEKEGVDFLGVSDVQEGILLRKSGIKKPIVLFESTLPAFAREIIRYQLTPTICTWDLAYALDRYAKRRNKTVNVHVKVDTGMGRLGVWHLQARDFIIQVHHLKNLRIEGIYTHFPVADTDRAFTEKQMAQLYDLVCSLDERGIIIPLIHAANSMGLAGYKTSILNLARPGLMIYGLYPQEALKKRIHLRQALNVHSTIIFIKKIAKGRGVSYGRTFISKKNMTVATIPIGYSNGYPRALSNKAYVLIGGQRCPVLGRVTMDQVVVDVSHVKNVRVGMRVVILGKQGKETISAEELAQKANTINYEVICNLGNLLPKIYLGK